MSPKLMRQALRRHPSRPQAQDAESGSPRSPEQTEITKKKFSFSEITKKETFCRGNGRQKWVTLFSVGEGDGAPTRPSARTGPGPAPLRVLSGPRAPDPAAPPPPLPRPARRPLTAAREHEAAARARGGRGRARFLHARRRPPTCGDDAPAGGRRQAEAGGGRQAAVAAAAAGPGCSLAALPRLAAAAAAAARLRPRRRPLAAGGRACRPGDAAIGCAGATGWGRWRHV